MPRDSSGVYSLPSVYLATPGTTILATQHNTPMEDIGQALTDSLPRTGSAPMIGPLTLSGNASQPFHAMPLLQAQQTFVRVDTTQSLTSPQQAQARTNIAAAPLNDPTFTGTATIPNIASGATVTAASGAAQFSMSAVAAQNRMYRMNTAGVARWEWGVNATAESGSNAGSDWELASYTDLGAGRAVRASIRRADGYANFFGSLEIGTPGGNNTLLLRRLGTSIGGAADLELPSTGSTLAGNVRQQLTANQWQLIENGGTQRGVRLDLTGCAAAAGSDLVHSGNLGAQLAAVLGPALAGIAHTAVGTYGLLRGAIGAATEGTSYAGSSLFWTDTINNTVGATATGNWRAHGRTAGTNSATLFQRTS